MTSCSGIGSKSVKDVKVKSNTYIAKSYILSDGTEVSLHLPPNGHFFSFKPVTNLNEILDYGRLFIVNYDKPRTFLKPYPPMFKIGLNIIPVTHETFLSSKKISSLNIIKQEFFTWNCDKYIKDIGENIQEGRRWVCYSKLNDNHYILLYSSMNPWVKVRKNKFDIWENRYFKVLQSINLKPYN